MSIVAEAPKPTMKFRILRGQHLVKLPNGQYKKHRQGEVIESTIDLVERFNQGQNSQKFQRIYSEASEPKSLNDYLSELSKLPKDQVQHVITHLQGVGNLTSSDQQTVSSGEDTLAGMTVKELQAFADGEEIDLKGITKRDDILRIIKAALNK
jgi:hypothetical protein